MRRALRTHLVGLLLVVAGAAPACRASGDRSSAGDLTVTDDAGRSVTLGAPARRIVSLLPSFTEVLFALGSGDRVVGRTTWCDWPAAARAVPSVGDGIPPNVEAVAARRPDLVVLYRSGVNGTVAEQLERLGIRTVLLDMNLFDDVGPAARRLGTLTGRVAAADSLARVLDSLVASLSEPRAPSPESLVFIVWDNPPIVIGAGSYLDQLASLAGARNVFHDISTPSAQVSIETIAARDPDLIVVLGDTAGARRPQGSPLGLTVHGARPEWRAVRAVRERRYLHLAGSLFGRPGPRAAVAVRELRHLLETAP